MFRAYDQRTFFFCFFFFCFSLLSRQMCVRSPCWDLSRANFQKQLRELAAMSCVVRCPHRPRSRLPPSVLGFVAPLSCGGALPGQHAPGDNASCRKEGQCAGKHFNRKQL